MVRGIPLTEEQRQQIVQLTHQGLSAPEIADRLNCTKRTVQRIRSDHGVSHPPPRRYTPDEIAMIERLLNDGASLADTARTIGRSPVWLWKNYRGRGWTPAQAGEFKNLLRKMRLEI